MTIPSLLPDLLLLLLPFLLLGYDLIVAEKGEKALFPIAISGTTLITLLYFFVSPLSEPWLGGWSMTQRGIEFRILFTIAALLALLFAHTYFVRGGDRQCPLQHRAEFLAIILLVTFGMVAMVSAQTLLAIFVALELATIPLYVLVGWRRNDQLGSEAATKYIIMGAASSGFMLFCFSYLYGLSGSLEFSQIASWISQNQQQPLLWLAVLMLFGGIGFKLTLFPFHMWAPDVYQGAPTPVTAFLSVSSKSTAVAFLAVMLYGPLAPIHNQIQTLILILAGFTMTIGNLGALRQRQFRRFMAYSSIAQAGYIITAFAGPGGSAMLSLIYYLLIFAASNYLAFSVFAIVGEKRGEDFDALRGLAVQSPALGGILAVTMFSLAGIPPVAGFLGKLFLFSSAAETGHYLFIVFAALNSTVSLYYYLRVVREAYIEKPDTPHLSPLMMSGVQRATVAILLVAVLLMGLLPQITNALS